MMIMVITMLMMGSSSVKLCSWLALAGQNLPLSVMLIVVIMMMMRIGSNSIEQCSWLNNGQDADEDRCYSRTMHLVIPC